MWHTPIGNRVLTGAERALFVLTSQQLYEELRYDQTKYGLVSSEWQSGNPLFDNEPLRTKVCAVHDVAEAFLSKDVVIPQLYAWNESTLHAIVSFCKGQLQAEIDGHPFYNNSQQRWQKTTKDALRRTRFKIADGSDLVKAFIEWATERWTWDEDWKAADLLMDMEPKRCAKLKAMLGLHHNYFSETFPLVTHGRYLGAVEFFESLAPEVSFILSN